MSPSMPDTIPACYGVGCFVALDCVVAHGQPAGLIIGTLSSWVTGAMVPIYLAPAVPPPRLQV
jgi:hypothetical protein